MTETRRIIDCLNAKYGISVTKLILLPLGADMHASVYKAETHAGPSYFVKLYRNDLKNWIYDKEALRNFHPERETIVREQGSSEDGNFEVKPTPSETNSSSYFSIKRGHHFDMSVAILALLQASGIQQIIPPIKTIEGKLTQHIDDFTLTVYPFIDGENGLCHNLTDDQWVTLGKVLRKVHEFEVPSSIQERIRKEIYSPKWRDAVRSLDVQIEAKLIGDEIALKLQAFMKEHRAIIHRLVERAEWLGQKIKEQSAKFVLCHSDIHGGNVLIDRNGALYIVDWDEPIMAPKERDLMFIGGGVANVWNNPHEEESFYKGYGKVDINRIILAYYRHERIVEDIAVYAEALLLTTAGGESRQEMYKQFMDMFVPGGVVEIAFKTDDGLAL